MNENFIIGFVKRASYYAVEQNAALQLLKRAIEKEEKDKLDHLQKTAADEDSSFLSRYLALKGARNSLSNKHPFSSVLIGSNFVPYLHHDKKNVEDAVNQTTEHGYLPNVGTSAAIGGTGAVGAHAIQHFAEGSMPELIQKLLENTGKSRRLHGTPKEMALELAGSGLVGAGVGGLSGALGKYISNRSSDSSKNHAVETLHKHPFLTSLPFGDMIASV